MVKDQLFKVRLTDTDRQRLDRLAAHYELPAGSVLRMLVKREDETLGLTPGPAAVPSTTKMKRKKKTSATTKPKGRK